MIERAKKGDIMSKYFDLNINPKRVNGAKAAEQSLNRFKNAMVKK